MKKNKIKNEPTAELLFKEPFDYGVDDINVELFEVERSSTLLAGKIIKKIILKDKTVHQCKMVERNLI